MINIINKSLRESLDCKTKMVNDENIALAIEKIAKEIFYSLKNGGKVLVCGNGGSAGDAQHIAGEFVNKFYFDRAPLSCISLSSDTSVLTCIGNDSTYDDVFLKQVIANGRKGDIFWGISTSGNSKNIIKAIEYCKSNGIYTFGLVGAKDNIMDKICDLVIKVPSEETPRIQELQIVVEHIICQLVEQEMFKE